MGKPPKAKMIDTCKNAAEQDEGAAEVRKPITRRGKRGKAGRAGRGEKRGGQRAKERAKPRFTAADKAGNRERTSRSASFKEQTNR